MSHITRSTRVTTLDLSQEPPARVRLDDVSVEEPLEIRIANTAYAITMRTPGHDIELVHGFLAAEGVISGPQDIRQIQHCASDSSDEDSAYNLVKVTLSDPGLARPPRATIVSSSCGTCGTESIRALASRWLFDLADDDSTWSGAALLELPGQLRGRQKAFDKTGGLHAAALFANDGRLLVCREDIGRHNAVDKVVGWAMLNGWRPGRGCALMVSGRTSFELVQKAAGAGIPILAGVSAPSSLAVDLARDRGLTLAGFVRAPRMNLYSAPERIR